MKRLLLLSIMVLGFASVFLHAATEVTIEEEITGLYVAYFNRAADEGGLTYWTQKGEEAQQNGEDVSDVLKQLSAGFAQHPSFARAYGDMDNQAFVEAVYRNTLGREGDVQGVNYWTGLLNGGMSRSDFVSIFVDAALTFDRTDPQYAGMSEADLDAAQLRQDLISNKVEAALAFTHQLGVLSNVTDTQNPESDPAYLASIKIISEVTEDHKTVEDVLAFLESIANSSDPIAEINNAAHFNEIFKSAVSNIVTMVTKIDDNTSIEGLLGAGYEAVLEVVDINDSNMTVELNVSQGVQKIEQWQLSADKRFLTFNIPQNVIAGTLTIETETTRSQYPYGVFAQGEPYLAAIEPDIAYAGDQVVLKGKNIPTGSISVVFEGQESNLTQTVQANTDEVRFTIPTGAASGNIYLQSGDQKTNALYLSVKRPIDVHVSLEQNLSIDASDISFVLGLEEYTLDDNYHTTLGVENEEIQYLHAMVNLPDGESALLYSAAVLPTMSGTVNVDANTTAIAWIMMGLSASVTVEKEQLPSVYTQIANDAKVQEFAAAIVSLQKTNFNAWANRSDETLKTKFQEALKSVAETVQVVPVNRSLQKRDADSNTVIITQNPIDSDIYVTDYAYPRIQIGDKLNNGTVYIVNDTKLYLSVEVRDQKTKEIVNGYQHVANAILTDGGKLIGPKGWGIADISSLDNLDLKGKDVSIEIISPAWFGQTDKVQLANSLRGRIWIEGIGIPSINMLLTTIMDRRVKQGYNPSNFVSAMQDIYGPGFLQQLLTQVSSKDNSWAAIADTLLIQPLTSGFNACFQYPVGSACETTLKGVAKLLGVATADDIGKKVLGMIADAAKKRVMKKAVALVPVVGWIAEASFAVYDNISYVTDSATIVESLTDMATKPKEIDAQVDFPLELSKVTPVCAVISPSDAVENFDLYGAGFTEVDGIKPSVFIGSGDDKSEPYDLSINEDGTQIVVKYEPNELIDDGSWESYMFIKHMGISIMYDKAIRMVSTEDNKVYFDSVVPSRAMLGQTVALNGCGWVPLDNVKVFFDKENDTKTEAEIISKSIDKIVVKVPQNAKSGLVYVSTGDDKKNASRLFDVIPMGLFSASRTSLVDGTEFSISGTGLSRTTHVYFVDVNNTRWEGVTENITDTGMWVKTPDGIPVGPVKLYIELNDGTQSNTLILKKIPERPTANPMSGIIGNGLTVTLSQKEGMDIYYSLNDSNGTIVKYTTAITLTKDDLKYTDLTLYAFARKTVNGIEYDSDIAEFYYYPCEEGYELNDNRECVEKPTTPNWKSVAYSLRNIPIKTHTHSEWINSSGTTIQDGNYSAIISWNREDKLPLLVSDNIATSHWSFINHDLYDYPQNGSIHVVIDPENKKIISGTIQASLGEEEGQNYYEIEFEFQNVDASSWNEYGASFLINGTELCDENKFKMYSYIEQQYSVSSDSSYLWRMNFESFDCDQVSEYSYFYINFSFDDE